MLPYKGRPLVQVHSFKHSLKHARYDGTVKPEDISAHCSKQDFWKQVHIQASEFKYSVDP